MKLNQQLLAEKLREMPPKIKILLGIMIESLQYMHFAKKKWYHYFIKVPEKLQKYYSEQETDFDRLFITYPLQEDQKPVLEFFQEIGVISNMRNVWLFGAFKWSRFDIDIEALVEMELLIQNGQVDYELADKDSDVWELKFDEIRQELIEIHNGMKTTIRKIQDPKYVRIWQYLEHNSYQTLTQAQLRNDLKITNFNLSDFLKNNRIDTKRKSRYFPKQENNRTLVYKSRFIDRKKSVSQ